MKAADLRTGDIVDAYGQRYCVVWRDGVPRGHVGGAWRSFGDVDDEWAILSRHSPTMVTDLRPGDVLRASVCGETMYGLFVARVVLDGAIRIETKRGRVDVHIDRWACVRRYDEPVTWSKLVPGDLIKVNATQREVVGVKAGEVMIQRGERWAPLGRTEPFEYLGRDFTCGRCKNSMPMPALAPGDALREPICFPCAGDQVRLLPATAGAGKYLHADGTWQQVDTKFAVSQIPGELMVTPTLHKVPWMKPGEVLVLGEPMRYVPPLPSVQEWVDLNGLDRRPSNAPFHVEFFAFDNSLGGGAPKMSAYSQPLESAIEQAHERAMATIRRCMREWPRHQGQEMLLEVRGGRTPDVVSPIGTRRGARWLEYRFVC